MLDFESLPPMQKRQADTDAEVEAAPKRSQRAKAATSVQPEKVLQ